MDVNSSDQVLPATQIDASRPVIFLLGPTASGKTATGIELQNKLPCQLISVDSTLVYRRMDIGSAKPSADELEKAPHSLIDIREPWQTYSAADFRLDALQLIAEAHAAGRIPVLLGGTMLYFQALEQGLSVLPVADATTRAAITQQAAEKGWAQVHQELAQVDPVAARRIHPNDPQRIQRALEVWRISGKSMSQWHADSRAEAFPFPLIKFALLGQDRAALHRVIEQRFAAMLDTGLLEEVAALRAEPQIHRDLPSMRAVGYRQAWTFLEGEISREQLLATGQAATRQLAKRQMTWMRSMQSLQCFDPQTFSAPAISMNIAEAIEKLQGTK